MPARLKISKHQLQPVKKYIQPSEQAFSPYAQRRTTTPSKDVHKTPTIHRASSIPPPTPPPILRPLSNPHPRLPIPIPFPIHNKQPHNPISLRRRPRIPNKHLRCRIRESVSIRETCYHRNLARPQVFAEETGGYREVGEEIWGRGVVALHG